MTTSPDTPADPSRDVSGRLRTPALVLSALIGLSALGMAAVAATASPAAWFVVGFELVLAVAAAMGVLFGLGRIAQAPPMTLALLAGAVVVCSTLGYFSTRASGGVVGHVPMAPLLGVRLGAAALLAAGAVVAALGASASLWRRLAAGVALVALPTAGAAMVLVGPGRPLVAALTSMGAAVAAGAALVAFLTWVGLVAAGGHMIITSFERALPAPWEAQPSDKQ